MNLLFALLEVAAILGVVLLVLYLLLATGGDN